jgi:hypothetical protein
MYLYVSRDADINSSYFFVSNQLDAQFFFMYVYFCSLHVSGSHVPIIRRINCISTTCDICHSVRGIGDHLVCRFGWEQLLFWTALAGWSLRRRDVIWEVRKECTCKVFCIRCVKLQGIVVWVILSNKNGISTYARLSTVTSLRTLHCSTWRQPKYLQYISLRFIVPCI